MEDNEVINKNEADKLLEKWAPLLDTAEGNMQPVQGRKKRLNTALVLENQLKWCKESAQAGSSSSVFGSAATGSAGGAFPGGSDFYAAGDARLPKVLLPMVRRTFPELITNEIVGVQPMTGPVGLAFAIRYKYQNEALGANGIDGVAVPPGTSQGWWGAAASNSNTVGGKTTTGELGYNYLDTRFTGTSAAVLSGANGSPTLSGDFEMLAEDQGVAQLLGNYELTGRIPQATISFEKTAVEAGTRRLAARWSVELEQDLKNMNNLDIDNEVVNEMSYEIQAEIDREMVIRMLQTAYNAGLGNGYSRWFAQSADARWLGERNRDLYAKITVESGRMAVRNRRGPANFIIATPNVCAALEMLPEFQWMTVQGNVNTHSMGVAKVGSIGGRYQVYRDTRTEAQYQHGRRAVGRFEYALLGYKGAAAWDTGIVYCPYIPVMVQRTIGPNDFAPRVGLLTRYGVVDHIFGASIYYHLILCRGMGEAFSPATTSVYL